MVQGQSAILLCNVVVPGGCARVVRAASEPCLLRAYIAHKPMTQGCHATLLCYVKVGLGWGFVYCT